MTTDTLTIEERSRKRLATIEASLAGRHARERRFRRMGLAAVVTGRVAWPLLGVNLLVTGVVPALVMVLIWRLVDRRLPDNLMVFLFICGFFGAALSSLAAGLAAVGLMALGASDAHALYQAMEYARFLPLLMPSEAFITGMLMAILLVYHPSWVATFNDHRYIDTK